MSLPILFSLGASVFALWVIITYGREKRALQTTRDRIETECAGEKGLLKHRLDLEQTMMDLLSDPLLLLDDQSHIMRANRAAFELLGAKLIQQDISGLLKNKEFSEKLAAVYAGAPEQEMEFVWNGPTVRTYEITVTPFSPCCDDHVGEHDDWPTVMVLMTDITTLKVAEESRIDFIANISHELRTPLASLVGFIETIRGPAKNDPEATDRFLGIMQDQAQRMARLVSDLLSLSRVELEEHRAPTDRVNLIKLLGNLWAAMELRAAEKGITIQVDSPRELPEIYGDWDQLIQALTNLVENAIKYGHENSTIVISASVQNDGSQLSGEPREVVALSVVDQGDGIPKENLEKLTERFYRAESAKARRIPGTGLGLAIVKHIVNRHQGRLLINSELGRGTSFTMLLPVVDEDAPEVLTFQAVGQE